MVKFLAALLLSAQIFQPGPDLAPPIDTSPFFINGQNVTLEGCEDWGEREWSKFLSENAPSKYARGEHQQRTPDGSFVDIYNPLYSIEVEWTNKWPEAIGQALFYAEVNDNKPAIYLIVKKGTNYKMHFLRLALVAEKYNIQVWILDPEDYIE